MIARDLEDLVSKSSPPASLSVYVEFTAKRDGAAMRFMLAAAAIAAVLVASAGPACAANLTIDLRTPDGQPVVGAVVTFHPAQPAPAKAGGSYLMSQRDIKFDPGLMVVPLGAEVQFPNRDKVRHHVYSFSPAKRFELKLYGKEEARTVRFDKPGVVALGCNIHDGMSGHIYVVDTPHVARSSGAGRAMISNAPDGAGRLTVWHPDLKNPAVGKESTVRLSGDTRQTVVLDLRKRA